MAKFLIEPHMRLHEWVAEWDIFPEGEIGHRPYEEAGYGPGHIAVLKCVLG